MDIFLYDTDESRPGSPVENTVHEPENLLLTDLSGVPICQICDRLLEEDQPKCELLCHHTFHTYCILLNMYDGNGNNCVVCRQNVFPARNEEREIVQEIIHKKKLNRDVIKLKKFEEEIMADKEILSDLKIVKRSITEARKATVGFKKIQTLQIRGFNEESDTMRKMLKSMKEERIKTIQNSSEAKCYRSKRAKAAFYIRSFERKYPGKSLERLQSIQALRLPSRWELNRILWGYGNRFYYRMRVRI